MNYIQVFLKLIILIKILTCETASTYNSRQANRKQQKLIEGSMDLQANPCDDFYQYACGKWESIHPDAGKKYYESISMLDYNANIEMSRAFNRISLRNKPQFLKKAYEFYTSCKDLGKYEPLRYLKWLKENENLKWPTLWTPTKEPVEFNWLRTLAIMRLYGLNNIFIEQIVMQRRDDPFKYILDLDKPVSDGGFTPLTQGHLKLLIESLGVGMTTRTFTKLWHEVEAFELELKKLNEIDDVDDDDDDDDDNDNVEGEENEADNSIDSRLTTIKDLPLPWLQDYLKIILNQTHLNPNMELYIQNIPYMMALDKLTKQHTQRFLCKYLELRFLWHLQIQGPTNLIPEDCLASARSLMPMAMHWFYEHQHPEIQQEFPKITELYEKIRNGLNETIKRNDHKFNVTVVNYLLAKVNNMKLKINNIPRINTIETLENFYNNLELNSTEFHANHLKLLKFNAKANIGLLNTAVESRKEFFYLENWETGTSSSPYFIQRSNTVIVPLTLLQQPIYHSDLDDIYKYSSLGFLLAHEIIHGFDNTGLEIDHKGKMISEPYDDIVTNPLYNASLNCLLELNPSVVDEKIADVSGLRYAYEIFNQTYPDDFTKTRRVYGQDMSLVKLFFLNFAQFFCGTSTSVEFVVTSEHGSDRDRVTDALTHFPEFSKVFQCSSDSAMYPHETCHIWRR